MKRYPPPVRYFRVAWDCVCGSSDVVAFDLAAKPHSRTRQCPSCGLILEVRQPIVLDLGIQQPRPVQDPGTGDSLKGNPS